MKHEGPEQPRQQPADLIMSAEQYAEITHEVPYIYEAESGGKKILYFGAQHTHDPENELFDSIEKKFRETQPDLVLIESMASENLKNPEVTEMIRGASREKAILNAGEGDFSAWLAIQNNVEVNSPEPPLQDQITYLLDQGFSKEHIFAYYYYRQARQYRRMKNRPPLHEDLPRTMEDFVDATQWENFDYSLEHLEEVGKSVWPNNYKLDDTTGTEWRDDPIPWKDRYYPYTVVNEVARACSRFRDRHIIQKISDHLKVKKRIFVVYGASHAVMQEPAIRRLLETAS